MSQRHSIFGSITVWVVVLWFGNHFCKKYTIRYIFLYRGIFLKLPMPPVYVWVYRHFSYFKLISFFIFHLYVWTQFSSCCSYFILTSFALSFCIQRVPFDFLLLCWYYTKFCLGSEVFVALGTIDIQYIHNKFAGKLGLILFLHLGWACILLSTWWFTRFFGVLVKKGIIRKLNGTGVCPKLFFDIVKKTWYPCII